MKLTLLFLALHTHRTNKLIDIKKFILNNSLHKTYIEDVTIWFSIIYLVL